MPLTFQGGKKKLEKKYYTILCITADYLPSIASVVEQCAADPAWRALTLCFYLMANEVGVD
jgi:hypothetical protein